MAERLPQGTDLATVPRAGQATRYPWHEWLDGSAWWLTAGEDFTVAMEAARRLIQGQARRCAAGPSPGRTARFC